MESEYKLGPPMPKVAPVPDGSTVGEALRATIDLARKTEDLGFTRFWVAEHHGMPGVASSSPPVLIGHIAIHDTSGPSLTQDVRIGLDFAMFDAF